MASDEQRAKDATKRVYGEPLGTTGTQHVIYELLQEVRQEERERCAIAGFDAAVRGGMERSVAMAPKIDKAIRTPPEQESEAQ